VLPQITLIIKTENVAIKNLILSELQHFQIVGFSNRYFPDIPLIKELTVFQFVFNIFATKLINFSAN
jgi:hypothetical protein